MIFPLGNLGNNVSLKRIFVICKRQKKKLMLTYGFEKVFAFFVELGKVKFIIIFVSGDERRTSDRI